MSTAGHTALSSTECSAAQVRVSHEGLPNRSRTAVAVAECGFQVAIPPSRAQHRQLVTATNLTAYQVQSGIRFGATVWKPVAHRETVEIEAARAARLSGAVAGPS